MKETGMLFKPEMVQAIRDGKKTQTRRVMKTQPTLEILGGDRMWGHPDLGGQFAEHVFGACAAKLLTCPYGQPGDRLYVKETWCQKIDMKTARHIDGEFNYKADGLHVVKIDGLGFHEFTKSGKEASPWQSPLMMPKKVARLWLELTDVRAERVQDISEGDAQAEGVETPKFVYPDTPREAYSYREQFKLLWNSINGPDAWGRNDWVWVLTFKRIQKESPCAL